MTIKTPVKKDNKPQKFSDFLLYTAPSGNVKVEIFLKENFRRIQLFPKWK